MKEKYLGISLADYQSILHAAPDLYLILNPKLEIVEASDAYLFATKTKRADILGHNIFEIFPDNPHDQSATGTANLLASLTNVLKNKVPDTMAVQKYDIRKPEEEGGGFEEHYWSPINLPCLDEKGELIFIIHRVEDVTEFLKLKNKGIEQEKLTEELRHYKEKMEKEIYQRAQEIQETNKQLRTVNEELVKSEFMKSNLAAIVEFTDDAIIGISLEGDIQSWNVGAEHLYGHKSEEVIKKSLSLVFGIDYLKEYQKNIGKIKSGQPFKYFFIERKHKKGHTIPVSATISPIKNKSNEIIAACSIERDISEWKRIEKIKNEFISVVSHELRTPLTSIRGSLAIILGAHKKLSPKKTQRLLDIANKNSDRLLLLINDILDVEKIEAGKMHFDCKKVNVNQLVKEVLVVNQLYAEKFNITLKYVERVQKAYAFIDSTRLTQVIVNLISNAVNFSPTGSEVIVTISIRLNKVRVSVSDAGKGIPKEFQHHIFQRFSQADSSTTRGKSGTGLGLYISKSIVEKMGGILNFKSKIGKGSIFFFEFPVVKN